MRLMLVWFFGWVLLVSLCVSVRADVHLVVGAPAQGGQYATVQAAIDAVPPDSSVRHVIDILPGTYAARVMIPSDKPFITLRGHGATPADTVLAFNETANTPPNESTVHASTVVRGRDFIAENLTFANTYGPGVQALAIYVRGDRAIFNNVRFTGWQDTLRSESGRHYFYNSYVEGSVDFIYGKGTAYFEKMTINPKTSGYVTAQARENAAETNGYVFKDSTITGTAPVSSVYLGRPWQAYARVVYIDTKMSSVIRPQGWATWSGSNHLTSTFAEYNSMDLAGAPLDVSQRVSWSQQLTAGELAAYGKSAWLGGADGWNPTIDETAYAATDFNRDGTTDGADFLVWQRGRGLIDQGDNFQGDATGDGMVDAADLADWQAAMAGATATGAVVPEPSAGVAAVALLIGRCAINALARRHAPKERVPEVR